MKCIAIVAHDDERGIWKGGTLAWHNPEDLRHFRLLTTGHPVIMGSTTYHSIGRPLPNRRNMVLTRHIIENDGVEEFASITECFEHLWIDENVFVIGGAQVYSQFLESNLLDEIWVSHISGTHECDVFFPDYTSQYEAYETEHFSTFDFIKFRRIKL